MAERYDHQKIEKAAQEKWAALDLYTTDLADSSKEPYYLLFEFPYPSGDLHIGHWYAFAVTDIYARLRRMQGSNVLFPIGFDAFGLPAENAAMKNGADPRAWTYANMDRMRSQIKSMGTSVDWSKEVITCDPSYYKWTQWLFARLFEHGLAERKEAAVKWCPKDQTVLANEQVIDGHCERCGTAVEEKILTQWFMKITQYAERLLNDLDPLPWREEIKEAQRAWIGKSDGAKLSFQIVPARDANSEDAAVVPDLSVEVFTTRPDTIYGATYVVLAPEHRYLNELLEVLDNETDVAAYIEATKKKTERERQEEKDKTGVRLEGIMAVNPATKEQIPVYVADYVLGSYGTGAVMAVPAHDERDFEFAKKHAIKAPPKKKYLIFDFDGVIADSFESAVKTKLRMDGYKGEEDARETTLEYARNKPNHTRDHSLTPDELKQQYAWTEAYGKIKAEVGFPLFEGFIDEILKVPNAVIAIVSSGSSIYVEPSVTASRLNPTHVLGFDNHHSKEEKIEHIANDWGVPLTDILYFTDTKADYFELENFLPKRNIIGCAWGFLGKDELLEVMPREQLLENFDDIHTLLNRDTDTAIARTVVEPLFIAEGGDAFRSELPVIERNAIAAIVRDPKTDRYLALKWKKADWVTCVTGGIEEGQTPEEAARAEILQETGYRNLTLVRELTKVHSKFFHIPKNENRFGHFHNFYFELQNVERDDVSADELAKHEAVWMTLAELRTSGLKPGFLHSLNELVNESTYTGDGILVNSGEFSGRENREALWDIAKAAGGERVTNYRIRDWLVSRQRYWGCPIPVVYDPAGKPHLVPSEHLPWLLPTDVDFTPTGKAPLASSKELHERVERIFGAGWRPEYDTLDTFVDSSWYFLRYIDPNDSHDFSDQTLLKKWLPVDRYSGGSEHTTMHLLYARFFQKALYDLALVPTSEPFNERYNRGIILGPDGAKMSKSKGNVVNPDEFVKEYGADAVRMYLAFIGPYNEPGHYPWNLDGVASMRKFLNRVSVMAGKATEATPSRELESARAVALKKVTEDGDRFKFNTALSALMVLLNALEGGETIPKHFAQDFIIMLAPFAPHLAEHLWEQLGGEGSVHAAAWPTYDPTLLHEETVLVVVQVNGKRRGEIVAAPDADEASILASAKAIHAVAAALGAGEPKKVVYVPGKVLNLVV